MQRGYEFVRGENCTLSYRLTTPLNQREVAMIGPATDLAMGESTSFRYVVHTTDSIPNRAESSGFLPTQSLLNLPFRRVEATTFKAAPVVCGGRVMLPRLIADLEHRKIRGLNLRANPPQALRDLDTLKDGGCPR